MKRIGISLFIGPIVIVAAIVLAVNLTTPKPAEAFIDEIIAAYCNGDAEPGVVPPGQVREGTRSFVRALQATGFIESIDEAAGDGDDVKITFDPTVPNAKFRDAGIGDVTIPDAFGPGVDLIFSPGIEPDPNFPAFANCPLFNP